MLVPMAKVELIGPKNRFLDLLSLLHDQGTLHIEDLSKKIGSGTVPLEQMELVDDQQSERERMSELLVRLRSILTALHLPAAELDRAEHEAQYQRYWDLDSRELSQQVTEIIEQVEDKTSSLAQAQSSMESELALLARYEPILQKIQPLARQIVTAGAFDSVALLVERRYKGVLEDLKKELDELTQSQCEIVSTDVDEDTTAVIVVFAKKFAENIHKFMAMENVNQIRLPSEFQDVPFDVAYEQIKQREEELPQRLAEVREELDGMSRKWYLKLTTLRDVLVDKIDEVSAIPKFGQTEYAFVITGWLPVDEVKALRRLIYENFKDDIIVNQLEITADEYEETPVALKNPKAITPFQTLLGMLGGGLPQYGTLDPSAIVFVFYPLIFGLIVGDILYGSVMLAVVLWLRKKYKHVQGMQVATSILGPSATAAIIIGFFYGEFGGNTLHLLKLIKPITLFGITLPFERTKAEMMLPLIGIALAVGIIQIAYGLILGVVNAVRTKQNKHAWMKAGLLMAVVGALFLALAMLPALKGIGLTIRVLGDIGLVVGILLVLRFGAMMGLVELLESISNIASYIRIMAVGLGGAIFADAINQLAVQLGPLMGAIAGLVLHTLNIAICAFSPNIHALRLNFLEFFGKFYEPSKEEYRPFHKTGGEEHV